LSGLTGVSWSGSIPFQVFGVTAMESTEQSSLDGLPGSLKSRKSVDKMLPEGNF
jgi:hypothetical protein